MTEPESALTMCERHVREGEVRVAHQEAILARLERDGHQERSVKMGRKLLATMWELLALGRKHLEQERAKATSPASLPE